MDGNGWTAFQDFSFDFKLPVDSNVNDAIVSNLDS